MTRGELGFDGEVWHHFGFHGDFSAPTADEALQKMNAARQAGADALRTADRIVLTFGTAWVYERQGEAVANCHRRPAAEFSRRRLSVEEIVTLSRLSRPTVLNILKELDTRGLIYRAGLGESMGGRQPIMYTLNLRRYFAVGVDLEYPPVRVAFSDLREKVLYSQEWDCLPGETMEDIEENLVNAIREGMRRLNIATENLIGIGLGIPGRVDIARNLAVRMDRMDHIWQGGDIAAQLSMKLGVPVTVRNDIHLLAAAERTVQPALPKNFLYVARRVGIGMAVFLNGKSYEGGFGNSGYLGHTVLDPEGPACRCGQRGCLECYATTGAVEINYARGAERPADYDTIVSRAQEGEPLAMAVLGDAGVKLAMAVVNAMLLYDCLLYTSPSPRDRG